MYNSLNNINSVYIVGPLYILAWQSALRRSGFWDTAKRWWLEIGEVNSEYVRYFVGLAYLIFNKTNKLYGPIKDR
jgi:hypothetical protein